MLGQLFLVCLGASLALGIGTEDILRLRQEIADIQKQIHRYGIAYFFFIVLANLHLLSIKLIKGYISNVA